MKPEDLKDIPLELIKCPLCDVPLIEEDCKTNIKMVCIKCEYKAYYPLDYFDNIK